MRQKIPLAKDTRIGEKGQDESRRQQAAGRRQQEAVSRRQKGSEFNGSAWTTDPPSVLIDNCRFESESRSAVSIKDGAQAVVRNSVIAGTSTYGVLCDSDRKDLLTKLFIENSSITGGAFSCIGICMGDGIGL